MDDEVKGEFCGSVLLFDNSWDKEKLIRDLQEDWGINIPSEDIEEENTIITELDGYRVVISKFPSPVPNQEAEINAQNNFMWQEAVEVTKKHKAHIVVAILGDNDNINEKAVIYVKIMASCSKQSNAIGVFTSGVVFEPSNYINFAQMAKEKMLPIYNLIWFGLYQDEKGLNAYTYGMNVFGKDEIEVLGANASPEELYDFIGSLASYVLEYDVVLQDGETIEFSEDDIHSITKSEGISIPGMTLKISYNSQEADGKCKN